MRLNRILLSTVILFGGFAYATPNFAREYGIDCTTCHTMIPMLNETGKNFLRDGFRFSQGETPSIKKLFKPQEGESRHIPFSIMLNANYDDQSEKVQKKVKLYTGGTLSENVSFFGLTKDTFGGKNSNGKNEFFDEGTSRAYLQLNFKGNQHVVRAGVISPLTQFGNLIKATADGGLKGHNSNTQNNQNKQGGNSHNGNHNKYGNQGRNQGNNAHQGNRKYMTPLQNSAVGNIKGGEYSYLANDKIMFLVSYGESVDKSNGNGRNGNSNNIKSGDDDYLFTTGVNYKMDGGYTVGFIYNMYEKNGVENESALIPIQKQFDRFGLVSTLVYKDETQQEDSYYGMENSLTYSISDESYIRGIVNFDKQDDDNNYGLSLTYSQMYKYLLFHITGVRKITEDDNENIFLGSVSLLF